MKSKTNQLFDRLSIVWSFNHAMRSEQIDDVMNYVYTHNIHVAIARSIVTKLASYPLTDTGKESHRGTIACLEIVKNGFKEAIFDDICQNIGLFIYECCLCGSVQIDESGRVNLGVYMNRDGKEVPVYGKLYGVVQNTLFQDKAYDSKGVLSIGYDCFDGETEKALSVNSPQYRKAVSHQYGEDIQNLLDTMDTANFLSFVLDKLHGQKLVDLFTWLALGYSQKEIAVKEGVSPATISERFKKLCSYREEYKWETGKKLSPVQKNREGKKSYMRSTHSDGQQTSYMFEYILSPSLPVKKETPTIMESEDPDYCGCVTTGACIREIEKSDPVPVAKKSMLKGGTWKDDRHCVKDDFLYTIGLSGRIERAYKIAK